MMHIPSKARLAGTAGLALCLMLGPGALYSQTVDSADYRQRVARLANADKKGRWPVKDPVPLQGALLPYHRIVAYYGNLYSKGMGILGELPKAQMLQKLQQECAQWQQADSKTTVLPALHYIAVTAQGSPGRDGQYRLRMPAAEIEKVTSWAREIKAITFVDIQVGHSTLQAEIPLLEKHLLQPDVHLGIDPEFSMKGGQKPGSVIGTFDAADVNYAIDYLAALVRQHQLPPKVLVVHRFTQGMLTNSQAIKKVPEVQVVIDMDGFGAKNLKLDTYRQYVASQPVQFTGFKLFYKNDKPAMLTPAELVKQTPAPIYIQYQ